MLVNMLRLVLVSARGSSHSFKTEQAAARALIQNYQPRFMGFPSFGDVYFFNLTSRRQESVTTWQHETGEYVVVVNHTGKRLLFLNVEL